MANNKRISIVFFDIGGVLADIRKEPIHILLRRKSIAEEKFSDEQFHALQTGRLTPPMFLLEKSQRFNLNHAELVTAFSCMLHITATSRILSSLRVPYLFQSNINAMHFDIFCRANDVSLFAKTHSLLSYQVGHLKPDTRFFQQLDQSIITRGLEALYIDDKIVNLERASLFGWKTALCKTPRYLMHVLHAYRLI